MRTFRFRSELAVGFAAAALVLMTVATVILAHRTDDLRRDEAVIGAQDDAEALAGQVAVRLTDNRPLDSLLASTSSRHIEILDPVGRHLQGDDLVDDPDIADAVSASLNTVGVTAYTGTPVHAQAIGLQPVIVDDELRAVVAVAEALPARRGWRQLYGLDPGAALILAAAAALVGWMFAGQITRPLSTVTNRARALLLDGPNREPIATSRIREMNLLNSAMTSLDTRMRTDAANRERVTDDLRRLSHELRTPIATIRLRIDALADSTQHDSNATNPVVIDSHAIEVVERQLDRLETLARRLPTVSNQQTHSSVDIAAAAANVVQRLRPAAEWGHINLHYSSTGAAAVFASADEIEDAIANIVENAIKHSPRGRRVAVTVTNDTHDVTLTVTDEGPGIPHHWGELALQPGVTLNTATRRPGSGQGLAIVARTVDRYHGHLEINTNPTGTTVRIHLPIAPRSQAAATASSKAIDSTVRISMS